MIRTRLSRWWFSCFYYYCWLLLTVVEAQPPPSTTTTTTTMPTTTFTMPPEDGPHEATWLSWPHNFGWDPRHVERYEPMWIAMTEALTRFGDELVKIIVYDDLEEERVWNVLMENDINTTLVEFYQAFTDDVWIRDNGPIFVDNDTDGSLVITDWIFNGWGNKQESAFDDPIPQRVGIYLNTTVQAVDLVVEGGAFEVDGRGTFMAKRASILNNNRNPNLTQTDVENFFRPHLGVSNFIWLDGVPGLDLTDDHIDGTARFANGDTIVTLFREDFTVPEEYDILVNATDVNGNPYRIVHLPVTTRPVPGGFTGNYGIYVNFYAGNSVVLVPAFNDTNDALAAQTLQEVFPNKTVVSINSLELYADGGVIHCVTQQQHRAPGTFAVVTNPTPAPTTILETTPKPRGDYCFPHDAVVVHREKGPVWIRDIQVGDWIWVGGNDNNNQFEPVYGFGHKLSASETSEAVEFVQLTVATGETVTVTLNHMVFVGPSTTGSTTTTTTLRAVPAALIQLGDQLQVAGSGDDNNNKNNGPSLPSSSSPRWSPVVDIQRVSKRGLYAPFTPSGSIVVNGIRVSTFSSLQGTEFVYFWWYGSSYSTGVSHHWFDHTLELPHRLWSSAATAIFSTTKKETYMSNGMATWTYYPYLFFYHWWPRQLLVVRILLGIVIGVLLLILAIANILLNGPLVWQVGTTLLMSSVMIIIMQRKRCTRRNIGKGCHRKTMVVLVTQTGEEP